MNRIKVLALVLFIFASLLSEAKPASKYWHRKHQNRIFQRYIQSPKKHGIELMKLALIIGWIVFVVFILVFNYGAHCKHTDKETNEPDNVRQLFPDDDDEHVIF